jgi:pimeloyl-ACP methyl ester carboxylesterase
MEQRRWKTVLLGALTLTGAGCGWFFRAPKPVATLRYASVEAPARELLVLLPGRGDRARSFSDAGIIDIVKRTVPHVDVIAVDATLGYYIHRTLPERLHDDVIAPARGYDAIWLAGISMGGLGSVLYAENHAKEVAGVLLVAPFLGEEPVIGEIEAAGGLQAWQPPRAIDPDDYQRGVWRWLKTCTAKPGTCPRILLGFGSNDPFVRAHRLLAAVMPAGDVVEVPGGHEWVPWRNLFLALLQKLKP